MREGEVVGVDLSRPEDEVESVLSSRAERGPESLLRLCCTLTNGLALTGRLGSSLSLRTSCSEECSRIESIRRTDLRYGYYHNGTVRSRESKRSAVALCPFRQILSFKPVPVKRGVEVNTCYSKDSLSAIFAKNPEVPRLHVDSLVRCTLGSCSTVDHSMNL